MISVKNKKKKLWDLSILIFAVYNSIMAPFTLAYEPDFEKNLIFVIFDNVIDFLFVLDMIVMFLTTIINKKGQEIFDDKIVAKNYLKSPRFVADSLALFGNGIFRSFWAPFKLFRIFKTMRIIRIGNFITSLNIPRDSKAVLNLIKLTFYLFLWIHVNACMMNLITSINISNMDNISKLTRWYPPFDYIDIKSSMFYDEE